MVRKLAAASLACATVLWTGTGAWAHAGGVDADGCHMERRTGEKHCHPERARGRAPTRDPGPYSPRPLAPHNPALDFLPRTPSGTEGNPAFVNSGEREPMGADDGGRIPASECRAIKELNPDWRQSAELRAVLKRCAKGG